ncbi:MAG: hypothetical protein JJD98_18530 [Polaromonas sp.]|nr:hypothetical protein [Polaromonas sp.]
MIEMLYHLQLDAAMGSELRFMGMALNTASTVSWAAAAGVMLVALGFFEVARRRFALKWSDIQESIEMEIKRREAL